MTGVLADYLDGEQLAKELNISVRTVRRYSELPNGLPFLKIGGRILYRRASVLAWLESREKTPNPIRKRRVG